MRHGRSSRQPQDVVPLLNLTAVGHSGSKVQTENMSSSWGAGRHKCAPPKTLVSLGFLQWREKRNRSRCELTVNSPRSPRSPSPLWWWITALRPTAGQQLCSFTTVVVVVFLKERWELPSFPSVFLSYVPSLFTSPFFSSSYIFSFSFTSIYRVFPSVSLSPSLLHSVPNTWQSG